MKDVFNYACSFGKAERRNNVMRQLDALTQSRFSAAGKVFYDWRLLPVV